VQFQIRLADPADTPGIVRVVKACYDEYGFSWEEGGEYFADLYDVKSHHLDRGNPFWVAVTPEDEVLGTAALDLFSTIPGRPGTTVEHEGRIRVAGADCSMERLYVDPEKRKLGIGRALAQHSINYAQAQDRTMMELWTDKKLTKAHALYHAMGAKTIGERICHDPDQSPEWGMMLPLGV
jgi:putative acetyltransferase